MSVSVQRVPTVFAGSREMPALEFGDRLARAEFERRYAAMPAIKKAELLEGIVYMAAAVRLRRHGRPHAHIVAWLAGYEAETPGVLIADNASLRMDLDNEPQPDAALCIDPDLGGQARISEDDYLEGAPEFIAEVASSSVSYDLGVKLQVYRRNGVREYLVWRVLDRAVDWFVLREGVYERLAVDPAGLYRSTVFPGLWLDAPALLSGELSRVLKVLQAGLQSPDHTALVVRLRRGT